MYEGSEGKADEKEVDSDGYEEIKG